MNPDELADPLVVDVKEDPFGTTTTISGLEQTFDGIRSRKETILVNMSFAMILRKMQNLTEFCI